MQRFRIYTEVKKFYITNNVIVYSSYACLILIAFLIHAFLKYINLPVLGNALIVVVGIILFASIFLKLHLNWNTNKPLRGIIDGYLELSESKITINNKEYLLEEIKTIDIWNFDFEGEIGSGYSSKGDFSGLKSNGIENSFELTLLDGKFITTYFYQDYGNQIIHAKKELFSYYENGKIDFSTLARVFGCKDEVDRNIFRETLPPTAVITHGLIFLSGSLFFT